MENELNNSKKDYYSRKTSVSSNILNQSIDSNNVFGTGSSNLIKINNHPTLNNNDEIHNLRESVNGTNNQFSNGKPIFYEEQLPKQSVFVSARNLSSVVGVGTKKEKKILTDLNFFLKPGSMVLLLGSPGCGKTSLMNTLSLLTSNEKITGNLLFNGKEGNINTHHRHVSYVVQDDSHIGPLSVKDTLKFSADCQMGDKTEKERVERVENVLDFLGLKHVQNTVVGDNFLRGISGGQKKRVTIGVELIKDSNLLLMDEPTNGLDSSISLEILTKIRNKVVDEKLSCLVSLLQPGLEITKLFDYLMIMNQGQMVYFGPMNQGISYFESLGFTFPKHHNPAEFFQEIVDEPELYYNGGNNDIIDNNQRYSTGSIVPPLKGANEFAQAYIKSDIYKSILEYIDRHIPNKEDQKYYLDYSTLLKSYSISFARQLHLNVIRGFKIQIGNPSNLIMRVLKNVVIGLILGSLFWKLGTNQDDANNKSGLLFFSLLSFVFSGFSSISVFFSQREIFYHQKTWKYYDSMSYFFSMVINDIPLSIVEVLIFSNVVYWMVGLNKTWDRFIYFVLMCLFNDIFSHSMLKMVCSFSPNNSIATALSPAMVSPFLLLCGYMIKKPQIPNYWVWLYWISPIHYGFEGLLVNEHIGEEYHCDSNQLIPPNYFPNFNTSYPNGYEGNQVCPITRGEQVLESLGFASKIYYRWVDLAIVGGFILLFWTITAICMRFLIFRVYRKDPVGIKRSTSIKSNRHSRDVLGTNNYFNSNLQSNEYDQQNHHEEEMQEIDINSSGTVKIKKDIPNGCYIQWKNLVYEVDVKADGKNKRLRLLNNINGYVKPGMLLALMGPSGAGKSTLLDVLANRKTGGHTKGQILINGAERTKYFTRIAAYVEQSDILSPMLTVREAILFSAKTRLSSTVSDQEKEAFVDNILETLNLVKIQHSLIGDIESGISLSQRKRTNMGIELASDPQLLFLDEPTSGLDSSAALKVMNLIKKIASSGRSIICTIHQPSTTIFKKFDHLLLLKKGGETVYFGPTGKDSSEVLNYFSERGLICDPFKNPADFILDVTEDIIEIPSNSLNNDDDEKTTTATTKLFNPVESFKESEENQKLLMKIQHSIMPVDTPLPVFHGKYSSSMGSQIKELMKRSWKGSVRRVAMIRSRIGRSLILGLIIGTLFLRLDKEQVDVYNRVSLLFFSLMFGGMAAISMVPMVSIERGIFYRDQSSGIYRVWIYYTTFVLSDLPWVILTSYAYVIPVYFLTGLTLSDHGWPFFYHSFVSILVYLNFELFAIFLTSVLPIQEMAFLFNGVTLSLSSLFAGFMIKPSSIPRFWKWLYHIDFVAYPLKSYLITEFKDLDFVCTNNQGAIPIPIPSQNTTKFFCPVTKGTQVLNNLEFNINLQYWNLLIMSAFTLFFLILGFLSFKIVRYQNK